MEMKNLRYHHLGIPNSTSREKEDYFDRVKMYHTNYDDNPYGIEWLRFEPGSPLPEPVQTRPHIAFKVDHLEAALEGQEILIEPNSPSEGVKVAFILYEGLPIEFLEYDESKIVRDFPVLETGRLLLRQVRSEDAGALLALRSNPEVMTFMDTAPTETTRQALDMIYQVSRNYIDHHIPLWAVSLKEDDEKTMIGYVGYTRLLERHSRGEIAYALDPASWRRGIMTEALKAVIRYGFEKMKLHSIEASVNPENRASVKLLEKFAFRGEAYFKESYYYDGKFLDNAVYSLLNPG